MKILKDAAERHLPKQTLEILMDDIQTRLGRLERRDWVMWASAMLVMLALTAAVASFDLPLIAKENEWFMRFHLDQAIRGLVGLVLLFNVYAVYQQVLIKRLRRQLAEQIGVTVVLQARADELHKLATLDSLTELYNRRFADQRLAAEINRSQRYGHPLTVLLLDLDDFKHINDRYGHAAGDQVLREFAARLNATLRASDLPARMGGDEFMVVLPECRPEQVPLLLDRLHPLETNFRGARISITTSAGWAGYHHGERGDQLVERADQALYANKRAAKGASRPASVIT